jgi:hypothetical protein
MSSQSEPTNQSSWFLYLGGDEPEGPFSQEELMKRIRSSGVGEHVYVWRQGLADWMAFSEVKELQQGKDLAPPPPPSEQRMKEDTASGISGVNIVSPKQLEEELSQSDQEQGVSGGGYKPSPQLSQALQSFQSQAPSQEATDLHTNTSIRSVRKSGLFGGFINIGGQKEAKNPKDTKNPQYDLAHASQKSGPRMIQQSPKGSVGNVSDQSRSGNPKSKRKKGSDGLRKIALLLLLITGGLYVFNEYGYMDSLIGPEPNFQRLSQRILRPLNSIPGGEVLSDFAYDILGISLSDSFDRPKGLNTKQFDKLKKAAEADRSKGMRFHLELGPDPLNPIFFLSNNAPYGAVLNIHIKGQERKLIGVPSYEKKLRKMVQGPLISFKISQKSALAPGHYKMLVSLAKGQTPAVTKELQGVEWQKTEYEKAFFIKGKLKEPFERVLNNYLAKLDQGQASSKNRAPASDMRLIEVQQLVSTLRSVSKSVTDSLFKLIEKNSKADQLNSEAVMKEWQKIQELWAPIMRRLKKLSTKVNPQNRGEYKYAQAYLDSADWLKSFEDQMQRWTDWIKASEWEKFSRSKDSDLNESLSVLNEKLAAIESQLEEKSSASEAKEKKASSDK